MPKHEPDSVLVEAEQELSRLAGELETLVMDDDYFRAVLALGHRARTLFFGFIHTMDGPAPAAAMSLLRPGVEINLLLRFFGHDPVLHVKLWVAEGDRQRLTFINEFERDSYLRQRWGAAPVGAAVKEQLQREVDEARRQALAVLPRDVVDAADR